MHWLKSRHITGKNVLRSPSMHEEPLAADSGYLQQYYVILGIYFQFASYGHLEGWFMVHLEAAEAI